MSEYLDSELNHHLPERIDRSGTTASRVLRGILPSIDFGDPVQKIEASNARRAAMLAEVDALACRLAEAGLHEVIARPEDRTA